MRGAIVADEIKFGSKPSNRHASASSKPVRIRRVEGNMNTEKTPVLSLINTTTGEVRSRVVPNVTGAVLRKVIATQVDMAGSTLYTDSGSWYLGLGQEFIAHESVNHEAGKYVRGNVTTNQAGGFFSQLKRSIDGTHHHVSVEHLPRYLAEFDFRYFTRKMDDMARMERMMGQVGGSPADL
jgi:transposase-like protein